MYHSFTYADTLAAAARISWQVDDIIGRGKRLDFSKRFMPEALARVDGLDMLDRHEKRILNQIRGSTYLRIFGLVEEFILPFVMDHVRPHLHEDDHRTRALLQFASEEAKHIQLFKRFAAAFDEDFGSPCEIIGPPAAVAEFILSQPPLAVALTILHIEWMTQRHYVDSVRDNLELDPLFKSLLRHHWMEEAQHAKLDTLIVEAIAERMSEKEIAAGFEGYAKIGMFLDEGLGQQAVLDVKAFERATARVLGSTKRDAIVAQQHQANRWTYLGSGMTHPNFLATVEHLSPAARAEIERMAPAFC